MSDTKTAPAAADLVDQAKTRFDRLMQRSIKGLGYFNSPAPVVGSSPKDVVLSRGTMQLYHYHAMSDEVYRVPILMVMATSNRGYIFDMMPGQSFVEFLLKAGYDVFVLDWNPPRQDEKHLGLDDYVLDFIPACVAKVAEITEEPDVSVIGYCMGGVLSLIYAALHPDGPAKNLAVFTTPVSMAKMTHFANWADKRWFDVDRLIDTYGNAPPEMTFAAFDMLNPADRIAGNIRLWDNMWNDEYVKSYRMFDRWANDILPLAGRYFKDTVKDLMWEDKLAKGTLEVRGRPVKLENITIPFFSAVAVHDGIVPSAASEELPNMVGSKDKTHLELKGGHVSVIAGPNAVKRLWPAVDGWLRERST